MVDKLEIRILMRWASGIGKSSDTWTID